MILPCDGAKALSTPICIPSDPRFANPQREYDAIVKARCDSGFELAWMLDSSAIIKHQLHVGKSESRRYLGMQQIRFQLASSLTAVRLGGSQRWEHLAKYQLGYLKITGMCEPKKKVMGYPMYPKTS